MADKPKTLHPEDTLNNIAKIPINHRTTKEMPVGHEAQTIELCLPDPERTTPEQLLTALAREPAPDFQHAVVILSVPELCPCGCGELQEITKVFSAGPQMTRERLLWMSEKAKLKALGVDVGDDDE